MRPGYGIIIEELRERPAPRSKKNLKKSEKKS
jgi:hypothetical protein